MSWLNNAIDQLANWAKKQTKTTKQGLSQVVDAVNTISTSNTNASTTTNKNDTQGQQAQSNNQMTALNNAQSVSGGATGSTYKTYAEMTDEEKRDVAIEAMRDVYDQAVANGNVGGAALWRRNAEVNGAAIGSYTPKGTYNDADVSDFDKQRIGVYQDIYAAAMARGDTEAAESARRSAEAIRSLYDDSDGPDGSEYIPLGNSNKDTVVSNKDTAVSIPNTEIKIPSASAGLGSSNIAAWNDNYNNSNPQPIYTSKYDPKIDALLNEILNREDFSYNVENDPLYIQHRTMYNREGERAMRDTLAEAAAGAGGMNTYAMAAANQARNYYASQLNDKIPELYQLAYEMYLQDKESKVQDLGLLSDLNDKQYARFRDTMNDWRADKDFAYGAFTDAVTQGNWEKTFDYNQSVDNRNFANQNYWAEKEFSNNNYWAEKEWSASEQDKAKEEVWKLISLGVAPSADLVAKSGMNQTDIDLAVAAANAGDKGSTGSTDGNGYTGGGNGSTGGYTGVDVGESKSDVSDEIKKKAASYTDNDALNDYLTRQYQAGNITEEEMGKLYLENETPSLSDRNWSAGNDGGVNWFWGIDNNASVKDQYGNEYRLDKLVDALVAEGMERKDAKEYVKKLQGQLGL